MNKEKILQKLKNDEENSKIIGFLGTIFSGLHFGHIPDAAISFKFFESFVSHIGQNFISLALLYFCHKRIF